MLTAIKTNCYDLPGITLFNIIFMKNNYFSFFVW